MRRASSNSLTQDAALLSRSPLPTPLAFNLVSPWVADGYDLEIPVEYV